MQTRHTNLDGLILWLMLITILLFITTAISLNYFTSPNKNASSIFVLEDFNSYLNLNPFWKRILTLFLVVTLSILWEDSTKDFLILDLNGSFIIHLYNGFLSLNGYALVAEWVILIVGLISINICSSKSSNTDQRTLERYIFILSAITGGLILLTGHDFLTIFLGLELQSYSVYLLTASYKNYEPSEAAGLKYFLLGALSSALIFLGLALLYIYSGNSNFDTFAYLIASSSTKLNTNVATTQLIPFMGILLIFTGFVWKVAGAPVHAWAIDVYDAVPSKTSAIISLLPKIALTIFIVKILSNLSLIESSLSSVIVIPFTIILFSLIIGSFYGLFTQRIKRLLGYSSVLNIGFILMGGFLASTESNGISLFYIIQYVFSTLAIWTALILLTNFNGTEIVLNTQLQQRTNLLNISNNTTGTNISTIGISICITILILSVAGIPPMVGFFAKFEIIFLTLKNNYSILAFAAIIASIISTVYYLNIVRNIWFVRLVKVNFTTKLTLNYVSIDNLTSCSLAFITLAVALASAQYTLIFSSLAF